MSLANGRDLEYARNHAVKDLDYFAVQNAAINARKNGNRLG